MAVRDLDPPPVRLTEALRLALHARFGDRFSTSRALRDQHTQTLHATALAAPEGVLDVRTVDDVADALRLCGEHGCPVIPYGTGTSIGGHVSAVQGGITLDFARMNRILAIHAGDFDCRVEPGVTREQLNAELRHLGLFFPVDPGADASLGGMAATGASGTTTVRYGAMRQNVMGLQVVLADGSVLRTGGRARKSSAGYDLTRLLVGSEGTLAVTTELTLRLHPLPEAVAAAACAFPSLAAAVEAAADLMQSGLAVAKIELVDADGIAAVNSHGGLSAAPGDYLLLEFHGTPVAVQHDLATAAEIAALHGGGSFEPATRAEAIQQLWAIRRKAGLSALAKFPGSRSMATDVCVPISRLAQCVDETKADVQAAGLRSIVVGHVGDGNFHLAMLLPASGEQDAQAHAVYDALVRRALAMEGTCSGEHGIGLAKQEYLLWEHGSALGAMRAVKRALDPGNLLNPGKVFQ